MKDDRKTLTLMFKGKDILDLKWCSTIIMIPSQLLRSILPTKKTDQKISLTLKKVDQSVNLYFKILTRKCNV